MMNRYKKSSLVKSHQIIPLNYRWVLLAFKVNNHVNNICVSIKYAIITSGEIPKRLKGAVSKTARGCKSCKGSNPFFSATINKKVPAKFGTFNYINNNLLFYRFHKEISIYLMDAVCHDKGMFIDAFSNLNHFLHFIRRYDHHNIGFIVMGIRPFNLS